MHKHSSEDYADLPSFPTWPELRRRNDERYERIWPITLTAATLIPSENELQKKQRELSNALRSSIQAILHLDNMRQSQNNISSQLAVHVIKPIHHTAAIFCGMHPAPLTFYESAELIEGIAF